MNTINIRVLFANNDDKNPVFRDFTINESSLLIDFNDAIIASFSLDDGQMTSFFTCNEYWEKDLEITLLPMGEDNPLSMQEEKLNSYVSKVGDKLLFVYDFLNMHTFFIEVLSINKNKTVKFPECYRVVGELPDEILDSSEDLDFLSEYEDQEFSEDEDFNDEFNNNFEDIEGLDEDY